MANSQTAVVPLTVADVAGVVRIYAEVTNRSYIAYEEVATGAATPKAFSKSALAAFRQKLLKSIGSRTGRVYVARHEGSLVGFIVLALKRAPAGHRECWILDIAVKKSHRRMSTAKRLMTAAHAFGKRHKVKYFFLESGTSNHGAHEFFNHEGFAPLSTIFVKEG